MSPKLLTTPEHAVFTVTRPLRSEAVAVLTLIEKQEINEGSMQCKHLDLTSCSLQCAGSKGSIY